MKGSTMGRHSHGHFPKQNRIVVHAQRDGEFFCTWKFQPPLGPLLGQQKIRPTHAVRSFQRSRQLTRVVASALTLNPGTTSQYTMNGI